MQKFNDFYQGLDFLNLILFWGIVIVIILIMLFLVLSFIRSKDNKYVILDDKTDDDDILDKDIIVENKSNYDQKIFFDENNSMQGEIVIESNKEEKEDEIKNMSLFDNFIDKPDDRKNNLYQKNVFREMSSRYQTSPIGIIKENNNVKEYKDDKEKYLEDVYNNLEKATVPDKIELTDYEKKQEEDAVISYQELMKKKDSINIDEGEDVIISYNELINRNDKLYNIREEEQNEKFLSELKKFRNDL